MNNDKPSFAEHVSFDELTEADLADIATSEEEQCICKHPDHGRCRRKQFHKDSPHVGDLDE
jgi:hypothetical protein